MVDRPGGNGAVYIYNNWNGGAGGVHFLFQLGNLVYKSDVGGLVLSIIGIVNFLLEPLLIGKMLFCIGLEEIQDL